jgi:hypothetical protein
MVEHWFSTVLQFLHFFVDLVAVCIIAEWTGATMGALCDPLVVATVNQA